MTTAIPQHRKSVTPAAMETIDKSTFTTFYSSLIGLKAQTKDESLVQAKDAEFTAVFHMTDGDLTFAYSPYDSSFYYTVDEDGVPSLVNKNKREDHAGKLRETACGKDGR